MSFFARKIVGHSIPLPSAPLVDYAHKEVEKDGIVQSFLSQIDPSKDIDIPKPSDYTLEMRIKSGVDLSPVSLNVSDDKPSELEEMFENSSFVDNKSDDDNKTDDNKSDDDNSSDDDNNNND